VRAPGPAGLRYAVETLEQLLASSPRLPVGEIEDEPDFAMRGIMLDVSRSKVPTFETLCGIVDVCLALKLNTLMLYTEHTFRFRRHPEIGKGASPLDAETMRELDQYAAERFVDLIPCLQSLGHMDHILELAPYRELAETEMGWTIAPEHPGSIQLLRDLYDEYLPNFRSRFFNANCDEPWDLGRGQSKERSDALGPGGLFLEHVERLRALAARHGKRTMIWSDVVHAHPERIPEIDRRMVMLDWWYEADFDFDRIKIFREQGLEFAVCPGTSTWNALFPRVANSEVNISRWAEAGRKHGAMGLINTDWGDYGHYNLLGNSWFAYAWGAQESWSGSVAAAEFDRAFGERLFGDLGATNSGKRGGASREIAKLYRELGAVHDTGFSVSNGSPIQYLFFDDLEVSYFISACKKGALLRTETRLSKIRDRIERAKPLFRRELLTYREIAYAADASIFAIRKAIAARRYNEWRKRPSLLQTRERKKLAKTIGELAKLQTSLLSRLRRLWLARSAISNFDLTERRAKRSARSLRAAARHLDRNTPPEAAAPDPFTAQGVTDAVRRSLS